MEPTIRAVLFDAVGTLIFPDPPVAQVYQAAAARHGATFSLEEVNVRFREAMAANLASDRISPEENATAARFLRRPTNESRERQRWREIVAGVFPEIAETEMLFHELWSHFGSHKNWSLYDDALQMWNEYRQRDLIVGIASNFDERLISICRNLRPLGNCPHIYVSSQVGYPKPCPKFFGRVQQALQLPANEILLIGDDPENDHHGATNAGWHSQLIRRN